MKSVLIISTCYEVNSCYTFKWASELRDELVKQPNTVCLLYDGATLCRAGTTFHEAVERVDYVVFYGHGSRDEWIALPELGSAVPPLAAVPLIDVNTVDVMKGKRVYAGCCWSLQGLGRAHITKSSQSEFVGYDQEFNFEHHNETHFKDVVNRSVISYVNGDSACKVASDLQTEWATLRDRFAHGNLKNSKNLHGAIAAADRNCLRVGSLP